MYTGVNIYAPFVEHSLIFFQTVWLLSGNLGHLCLAHVTMASDSVMGRGWDYPQPPRVMSLHQAEMLVHLYVTERWHFINHSLMQGKVQMGSYSVWIKQNILNYTSYGSF